MPSGGLGIGVCPGKLTFFGCVICCFLFLGLRCGEAERVAGASCMAEPLGAPVLISSYWGSSMGSGAIGVRASTSHFSLAYSRLKDTQTKNRQKWPF